jgi:protease I
MRQDKILIIIAQFNFEDVEFETCLNYFRNAGFSVFIASEQRGEALGKYGLKTWVDYPFVEVNLHDYDAIVYIGGPGVEQLFNNLELLNLTRDAAKTGIIIGAICAAPTILANAGILNGIKATAFRTEKQHLESKGAIYTNLAIEVSGQIVTAYGPELSEGFAETVISMIENK